MTNYVYYPGCSLGSTAREYQRSVEAVAEHLGLRLHELADWSCCGSSATHGAERALALALPARNLNLAAAAQAAAGASSDADTGNEGGLLVPCAACYSRLRSAQAELNDSRDLQADFDHATGEQWLGGNVRVRSLVEVLWRDLGPDAIRHAVKRPLAGLRVASYYGCLLVRPPAVTGWDDPEDPVSLDELTAAAGAEPLWWPHKVECCGAGLSISRRDIVGRLVGQILSEAIDAGADLIVTACPMCHANLDTRQDIASRAAGRPLRLPVLYITQLLGLAFGYDQRQLGLGSHLTSTAAVTSRLSASAREVQ